MTLNVFRFTGLNSGLAIKAPVRCATVANITLSGFQTIDGVTLSSTDTNLRVLVLNQTDARTNGLYDAQAATWTRCADWDSNDDFISGTRVFVVNGTTQGNTTFILTSPDPITLGTSNITFAINANFGSGTVTATEFTATAAANADAFVWGNGNQTLALRTRDSIVAPNIGVGYLRATTTNTPTVLDIMPNGSAGGVDPTGVAWIDICDRDLSAANSVNFQTLLLACLSTGECRVGTHYGGSGTAQILKLGGLQVQFLSQAFGSPTQYGYMRDLGLFVGASGTETFFAGSSSTGNVSMASGMALQWSTSSVVTGATTSDLSLFRDAAGTLAQRNSTTVQIYQQYKTFTNASNYERLFMGWDSGNATYAIKGQHLGTGSARSLTLTSDDTTNSAQLILGANGVFTFNVLGSAQTAALSISGVLTLLGALATSAPNTQTGATYNMAATDSSIIANASGTLTITLLSASSNSGRYVYIKTIANQAVASASSNVCPVSSATPGTAILSNTAGKWAILQSDGSNWITMASN